MSKSLRFCFYGFANTPVFYKKLVQSKFQNHETSFILPTFQYVEMMRNNFGEQQVLYLYDNFNQQLKSVRHDDPEFEFRNYKETNLFEILASDKGTYQTKPKEFQLSLVKTIFKIYRDFLVLKMPEIMVMPDVETVEGLVLLNLCHELRIKVFYYVHNRYWDGAFFSENNLEKLPSYFGSYNQEDFQKAQVKVEAFLVGKKSPSLSTEPSLLDITDRQELYRGGTFRRWFRWMYFRLSKERYKFDEDNFFQRIKQNISPVIYFYRGIRARLWDETNYLTEVPGDYPTYNKALFLLQVTPESSINTLAPYFVDQLRAIDLARLSLPPKTILYIKEHPAMKGLRPLEFYRKLKKMSGVVLLAPQISTKKMIQESSIIFSVTGTVGLESFLNGIPCILFGQNYFSYLNTPFLGLEDLKIKVHSLINNFQGINSASKIQEIAKIINVSYEAHLLDPFFNPFVLSETNINSFHDAIFDHLARLKNESN